MRTSDLQRLLLAERSRLAAQIARIETDFAAPLDDDLGDQASERSDDEALEGEERVAVARTAAIDAALARLQAGTYGVCLVCGSVISAARLAAIPEATRCARCALAAEAAAPR
ncbi:MAG: TraR/DksA family transcriptional regulator [Sphingomonas sp.]